MQVFHTAGVPPRSGSTILAIIGCTTNSSEELRNSVTAKRKTIHSRGANTMPGTQSKRAQKRHKNGRFFAESRKRNVDFGTSITVLNVVRIWAPAIEHPSTA